MVDTTIRPTGAGHPFGYLDLGTIEQSEDKETLRLTNAYDPDREMVVTLLKPQDRLSTYQVQVISLQE